MKKQLLAFAAAACALSSFAQTTVPTLSCSSLVSELNTGALNGAKLGTFQQDPIWSQFQELTNSPQTPPPNGANWVQGRTTGTVDGSWAIFGDAQWLSPGFTGVGGANNQSSPGNWWPRPNPSSTPFNNHYRVQFNLSPEVPPSALRIEMEYMGDDVVKAAYVNGVAVAPFSGGGFGGGVYTTLNSGWVAGLNTLVFTTADTGWAAGFLARARTAGESVCSVSPISVTKTADKASYVPGETINYSVTVTSQGLVAATGLSLADAVPAGVANPVWTCSAGAGTAVCPSPVTSNVVFDLPAQSSLVFSLSGTVTGRASLDNTATISPGTGGVCSATTGCSATVTPPYTASSTSPISITKTADQASYQPGQTVQYAITVTNEWTANATGLMLADPLPAGISNPVWSCAAAAGAAVCPVPAAPGTSFDLPGNSSLVFTLKGTVTGLASLDNTATVNPGIGGECAASTGCSASVSPSYTAAPPVAQAVPGLGAGALAALTASLGLLAWRRKRDQRMRVEK